MIVQNASHAWSFVDVIINMDEKYNSPKVSYFLVNQFSVYQQKVISSCMQSFKMDSSGLNDCSS